MTINNSNLLSNACNYKINNIFNNKLKSLLFFFKRNIRLIFYKTGNIWYVTLSKLRIILKYRGEGMVSGGKQRQRNQRNVRVQVYIFYDK